MSMFNSEQEDFMRELSEIHPSKKCYCGWHGVACVFPDYCEHCRAEKAIAYWQGKEMGRG